MTVQISTIGDTPCIILDGELMNKAGAQPGDRYSAEINEDRSIILTPAEDPLTPEKVRAMAARLIQENDELFRRLS